MTKSANLSLLLEKDFLPILLIVCVGERLVSKWSGTYTNPLIYHLKTVALISIFRLCTLLPMSLPNFYFIWLMSLLRVSCSLYIYVHSQGLQILTLIWYCFSLRCVVRCLFIRSRGITSGTMTIPRLGIVLALANGVAKVMFPVVSVHQSVILSKGGVPPDRTLALPLPWKERPPSQNRLQCISTLYTNYWYGTISIIFA